MSEQQQQPTSPPPPVGEAAAPPMPPRPEQQEQAQYYPPPPPAQEQTYYPPPPTQEQTHYPPPPAQEQTHYPPPPPRIRDEKSAFAAQQQQQAAYHPSDYVQQPMGDQHLYPPPPQRHPNRYSGEQDITSPIHYTRDPKKLVAYLIPFPKPRIPNIPPEEIPPRFMIYTPPPPPFVDKPAENEKEGRVHKVQRKWQDEIREAKTQNVKTMSWKGVKGKAIKGINWGMGQTKSSNLEFLNRIGAGQPEPSSAAQQLQQQQQQPTTTGEEDKHAEDGHPEGDQTAATVKLEEMLLVYPSSMSGTPEQLREEFINTMLRSKSKAQRDAVIATGLLPVSFAIDVLVTVIWPFGGLLEIDAVWAAASIRGAKNSRSVTKRLTSTSSNPTADPNDEDKLHLNFTPSPRIAVLEQYLAANCYTKGHGLFPSVGMAPSESEVLEAIGWSPSAKSGQSERNWEDEQWEISEVKDDLRSVMGKAAKEWSKWCQLYEKDKEKALKK